MVDKSGTFLTSTKIADKSKDNSQMKLIYQYHSQLQSELDNLDNKVGVILKQHENDFLQEFQCHMGQVGREMKQLRQKIKEEEIKRRRDTELVNLQNERDWFRNEALRLDKIAKGNLYLEYKKSAETWKNKAQALMDDKKYVEELILKNKQRNQKFRNLIDQNRSLGEQLVLSAIQNNSFTQDSQKITNDLSISEKRYQDTINHLKNQLKAARTQLKDIKEAKSNYILEKGKLEDIFIECINEVRKSVYQQRLQSSRQSRQFRSQKLISRKPMIDQVHFDSFGSKDKSKILQLLVSNQKVQKVLFEAIFPNQQPNQGSFIADLTQINNDSRSQKSAQSTVSTISLASPINKQFFSRNRPSTAPKVSSLLK